MCGCKNGAKNRLEGEIVTTLNQLAETNSQDFTLITYNAPCGTKYVYSPTNALRQYNLPHYGRHTCNDVFYVHNDDIKRQPDIFVPVVNVTKTANVQEVTTTSEIVATDTAIQLAKDNNIDLATVEGSGANGKILKRDIEALIA